MLRSDEKSIREELEKSDPESAKNFALLAEWDLYEGVITRSSLIKVIGDPQSLNL